MDREEERIYDNRKDFRSEDRFKEDIRHYSELERKYLYQFVEVHNRRRHKRDLTIENWEPCYYFNVTEVNWKSFDSTTSQQTLDNTNNNDENIPLYKMMGED